MLAWALNGNPHLQQPRILFFAGIRSGILEHAGPRLPGREEGLGLPSELWTILAENHRPILIVEDRAYERARDVAGHVAQALKQAPREASSFTPLHWTGTWKQRPELSDRAFCFYDMQGQAYSQGRGISEEMASQTR